MNVVKIHESSSVGDNIISGRVFKHRRTGFHLDPPCHHSADILIVRAYPADHFFSIVKRFDIFKRKLQEYGGVILANIIQSIIDAGSIGNVPAVAELSSLVAFNSLCGIAFAATGPVTGAANTGNIEIMEPLLKKKPDINARSGKGLTALIIAAGRGHSQIVELLLKEGADASIALETD